MLNRLVEFPELGETKRCNCQRLGIAQSGKSLLKNPGPPRLEQPRVDLLGLESDNGGFQPIGFQLGNTAGDAPNRAARWRALLAPFRLDVFEPGTGGADVEPLMALGATVGEIIPESQRYFDYHHTTIDTMDQVNPRELQLGAAAMAALVYLVDQHGL